MTIPTNRTAGTAPVRARDRVKRIAAGVAATAVVAAGSVAVLAVPAQAAGQGPGYGTWDDSIGWQGAFMAPDGSKIYCAEPGVSNPAGATSSAGIQSSFTSNSPFGNRTLSPDDLAKINYVVSTYGQGDVSNREASAVSFAVKALANADAMYESHGYNGPHTLAGYVNWVLNGLVGGAEAAEVAARAEAIIGSAAGITAGPTTGGSGDLVFTVDPTNNYQGTVVMEGSPGATGTIQLTNGIFVSTGTNTISGATEGTAYQVTGVPPTDTGEPYKISGTGGFTVGGSGFAGDIHVWSTGGQQTTAGPGNRSVSNFSVSGEDPQVRGSQFLPVVATTATTYIQPGENFTDALRFSTTADDAGTNNNWFRSAATGNYATVTAEGTVYGPFASQPDESAEVPADAPVAGTATVTTTAADGPAIEYTATSDTVAEAGGYYTWVWSIDWNDQDPAITQYLVPGPSSLNPDQEPYYFQDNFGQVVESHIVPSDITAVSEITAPEVALSGESNDTIDVSSNGFWNQADTDGDGDVENIPVVFRGTAYFVPGDEAPAQQAATDPLPEGTVELGSTTLSIDEAGSYTPEEGILAPQAGVGYITWVWEIDPADQDPAYAQMVRPWTDDFGIPAETQLVAQPEVSTESQAGVKLGETFMDNAIVEGTLPANGGELTFEAYKVPMKNDGTGKWVVDAPETDADGNPIEAGDLSWVCTDENRVFTNVGEGQVVTENGTYPSPEVTADEHGKYLWVESMYSVPLTEGGESQLIAQGECGILNETTFAVDVTTKAFVSDGSGTAAFGEELWDTAQLTGYVPEGGSISFEVYQTEKGAMPVCDASTLLTTLNSSDAQPLTGGLYTEDAPLEIASEKWKNAVDYDSDVYFVEVTKDSSGREVSRGECGDPEETVAANAAVAGMARTDGSIVGLVAGGAGLIVLIGLGALLYVRRRNAVNVAE
jgi:hypothetical protein